MIKEPEDEEFERIEREQAERNKATGWRKRQIEDEVCATCKRPIYRKDEEND